MQRDRGTRVLLVEVRDDAHVQRVVAHGDGCVFRCHVVDRHETAARIVRQREGEPRLREHRRRIVDANHRLDVAHHYQAAPIRLRRRAAQRGKPLGFQRSGMRDCGRHDLCEGGVERRIVGIEVRGFERVRNGDRLGRVPCSPNVHRRHQFEILHAAASGVTRRGGEDPIRMARVDRAELSERVEEMIVSALGS